VSETFDRRLTPARPDVAAKRLEGRVKAARFVEGVLMQIKEGVVDMKRAPRPDAGLETQALYGDCFTVYDEEEGWAWGQLARDGYVGWIAANTLWSRIHQPTHFVAAMRTFVYPRDNIKDPPLLALPMGAEVAVAGQKGDFLVTSEGGFVFARHLAAISSLCGDFVSFAEALQGVPYLWGGKSSLGIDCSGLVQVALQLVGFSAPRDSDLQEAQLGRALDSGAPLRRGDLVFWKGHVGMMRDEKTLLHANAAHMQVTSEPLEAARSRNLAAGAGEVTAIKRLEMRDLR
jgi:cell wall-associated NlpC family hydrolase